MVTFLNKNFRFVFVPKCLPGVPVVPTGFSRFLIGAGQLSKYVGEKNAETVQKTAIKLKTDKGTCKFRKYGRIEIYVK